jgi:hypothetical protein
VFIGTVVSERHEPPTKNWDQEGTTYAVRVYERLRGQLPGTVQLFSENSSGRFPMEVGTKYLLFVYSDRGRTMVDNCGNSEVYSVSSPKLQDVRRLKATQKRKLTHSPAMEARTSSHFGSIAEIVGLVEAADKKAA